jgi:hypothetical protein
VRPGGTSVDPPRPIALIVVGVLVVVGIVIVLAMQDGDGTKTTAADLADAGAAVAVEGDTATATPIETSSGPSDELRQVVTALSESLEKDQVVSSANLAPAQSSVLLITSAYCGDSSLRRVLDSHAPDLRTNGVNLVRCLSRDGIVVFEKKL